MPAELPDEAVRIRNLYPILKTDRAGWKRVIELTRKGGKSDIADAEALALAHTRKSPRNHAMHTGAIRKRIMRRTFLMAQKRGEQPIQNSLRALADRAAGIVTREARAGVLPAGRYGAVIASLTEANKETYKEIARTFQAQLRGSVTIGLKHSMQNAKAVVDHVRAAREGVDYLDDVEEDLVHLDEADPLKQKVLYSPSSDFFKRLFKGALKDTMKAGLFGDTGVSSRVWDLRGQNMAQMKRMISSGIARGDDPATISRDIRGILIQPKTLRGAAFDSSRPGVGVYRSAYQNAMRLTRTETNRAYVLSDTIFADEKGWNLIWTVSTGQREEDECDELGGEEMTPEEFAKNYPQHPNDLCYSILAPKAEFESPLSDRPAEPE